MGAFRAAHYLMDLLGDDKVGQYWRIWVGFSFNRVYLGNIPYFCFFWTVVCYQGQHLLVSMREVKCSV